MKGMKRIAWIIPWYGKELKGGAEQLSWQLTHRLAERGHKVDVLSTCCKAFLEDWGENHLRAGWEKEEDNLKVCRFPVDKRDQALFNAANSKLLAVDKTKLIAGVCPVQADVARDFFKHNIRSSALNRYLEENADNYDAFFFIPYLYSCVIEGISKVKEKAWLIACYHDEVYAYLPQVAENLYQARGLLFNSLGEQVMAGKILGPAAMIKGHLGGVGVEQEISFPDKIKKVGVFDLSKPYFFCLGRRDITKGVDFLIEAYLDYRNERGTDAPALVLAGVGTKDYSDQDQGIYDVGPVSVDEKDALLKNSLALLQPSENESFSRVMMEAWRYLRPVLVNQKCDATRVAVIQSGGGWSALGQADWAKKIGLLEKMNPEQRLSMGKNGDSYQQEIASWDRVIDRYEKVLEGEKEFSLDLELKNTTPRVIQLLPDVLYGDAISCYTIFLKHLLQSLGLQSEIFTCRCDSRTEHEVIIFNKKLLKKNDILIYHHSIGSELTPHVLNHTGKKALIYHNITPGSFFKDFRPDFAKLLDEGRGHLADLKNHFLVSAGDSDYNRQELESLGFPNTTVLPIPVFPDKWNAPADESILRRLSDGATNILFVGRVAPNKKQDDLVDCFFEYLRMDDSARLFLVGNFHPSEAYYQHVQSRIEAQGLRSRVFMTGLVTEAELQAYYRTAHIFFSMSEHEGFCIPLLEAMWFDIPVLAFSRTAVPETLGSAGLLFNNKENPSAVAALARLLVKDHDLRETILNAQRERREHFLLKNLQAPLSRFLKEVLA